MSPELKPRVTRVLGELGVVFIGVLVALAVDAWWDGVQDRAQLDEYLDAVTEDLTALESTLANVIEARDGAQTNLSEMIALIASDEAVPDSVVFPGLYTSNPFLPIGTLEALLDNASLEHMDPEIRSELASYRASLEWHRSSLDREAALMSELVTTAVRESDRVGSLGPDPQARPLVSALQGNREFLGIARAYYVRMDAGLSNLRDLLARVGEVRSLLDSRR